jgi:ATP-dependent Zn protease
MLNRFSGIAKIITFGVWLLVGTYILAGSFNLIGYVPSASSQTTITYPMLAFSDFVNDLNRGQVADVTIKGHSISGHFTDGRAFSTYAPDDPNLISRLIDKNVRVTAAPVDNNKSSTSEVLLSWLPTLFVLGIVFALGRHWSRRDDRSLRLQISDLHRRVVMLEGEGTRPP